MALLDKQGRGALLHGHLVNYGGDIDCYDNEDLAETLRALGSWIDDHHAIPPRELCRIFLDAANIVERPDKRLARDEDDEDDEDD